MDKREHITIQNEGNMISKYTINHQDGHGTGECTHFLVREKLLLTAEYF